MISLRALSYLASQKEKDATVLFQKGRYAGALYLMGYALEFALKKRISQTLGFINGFPEYSDELNEYITDIPTLNATGTGFTLTKIRQIKHHDLNILLKYSGIESLVIQSYYSDWLLIRDWNPTDHYKIRRYTKNKAMNFMISAKIILNQII